MIQKDIKRSVCVRLCIAMQNSLTCAVKKEIYNGNLVICTSGMRMFTNTLYELNGLYSPSADDEYEQRGEMSNWVTLQSIIMHA